MLKIIISIHPKCLIEEKAIILRKRDWLNPLSDPIRADREEENKIIIRLLLEFTRMERGAIFCHVNKKSNECHCIPSTMEGNHW